MSKDPEGIFAWQRLSDRITTSGFLKSANVPTLAEAGIERVINLAPDDARGALAGEAEKMAQAGLDYVHIPIPFSSPSEEDYAAFVSALEADERPVHVHCIANWRVSAFFYRYHRERGMAASEARALLRQQWTPERNVYPGARKWAAIMKNGLG